MMWAIFLCVAGQPMCSAAEPPRWTGAGWMPGTAYESAEACERVARMHQTVVGNQRITYRCLSRALSEWRPSR